MTSELQIIKPAAISVVSVSQGTGAEFLLSPSPREIWAAASTASAQISIDMGSAISIDGFYLGATNAAAGAQWSLNTMTSLAGAGLINIKLAGAMRMAGGGPRYHTYHRLAAPVASRFFRIDLSGQTGDPLQIGNLVLGEAFDHAYDFGSGRRLVDLSRVAEHQDGGFGVDFGAVKAALQFSFSDLSESEVNALWDRLSQVGISRPIVVVEGYGSLSQRDVHYGLMDRFEAFERANPADTKWALAMTEWL